MSRSTLSEEEAKKLKEGIDVLSSLLSSNQPSNRREDGPSNEGSSI